MQAFKEYLARFPHFTLSSYEAALPHLKELVIKEGDHFLDQGRTCKHIAFVESGLLRQFYLNEGKEITNCFCRENTISTSYKSLITRSPSDISIQAIEETRLITLSYGSLQELYEQDLFWQQLGRLAGENEYIAADRHNRMLSDLSATDRYLRLLKDDKDLLQRVQLNHLASYLQITPETLSRIRNKLART